jgi:putative peptidoglycan lipid II flippase
MRRLARDVLLMAVATGASRLLGLVREAAIADRFGADAAYDAFLIAFFVPHFLRSLLAEGALSTAFVPIYTGLRVRKGEGDVPGLREDADRFASNLLSILLVLFPVTVGVGIALAPAYVPFLATGFPAEKMALATTLTRIVFPFIALIGFAAVFMGILNARHRFFPAAFAPVWFNVGMILGVLVVSGAFPDRPIVGLAIGVLIGGAGQLLSQIPSLVGLGFRFRFGILPFHPAIREFGRRIAPAVLALAVAQINLLVDNRIASYLEDGGISALGYAMRLFQLPLGVFAVSIATALLPRLSAAHARGERGKFARYVGDGFAASCLILLPAMAGLLIVGRDVVRLLFEHGSFGPLETARTAGALSAYIIGLLPYGLVYVQTRACYALGRTVLPVLASVCAVGVNVALDLALVGALQERGLALATAAAGLVNASILFLLLRPAFGHDRSTAKRVGLAVLGTALMSGVVFGVRTLVSDSGPAIGVFIPTIAGIVVFAGYVRFTGLWNLIRGFGRESGMGS